jgi:hypothetical protein
MLLQLRTVQESYVQIAIYVLHRLLASFSLSLKVLGSRSDITEYHSSKDFMWTLTKTHLENNQHWIVSQEDQLHTV